MGKEKIWDSPKQKSLGMEIGINLNFDGQNKGRKLAVSVRLSKFEFKTKADP